MSPSSVPSSVKIVKNSPRHSLAARAIDPKAFAMNNPNIADDITALVGQTPLVRLNRVVAGSSAKILVKLETMGPSSSVKDRIALGMILGAEKRGDIVPGVTTLVEPTSGNTGIGLAMVAAARGYQLILTMADTMSMERRVVLLAYGAKLVLTPASQGVKAVIKKAEDIAAELAAGGDKKSYMFNQFINPDNPRVHRETTGPELWAQTKGEIGVLVSGVGTGGTLTGCAQFLKPMKAGLRIVAVEPAESAVLSGGPPGPHKIAGIGTGFVPRNCEQSMIDEVITVTSDEALDMARAMAKQEGILVGISAGAAVQAALSVGKRPEMAGKTICVIIPSSGERYLSTILFQNLSDEAKAMVAENVVL